MLSLDNAFSEEDLQCLRPAHPRAARRSGRAGLRRGAEARRPCGHGDLPRRSAGPGGDARRRSHRGGCDGERAHHPRRAAASARAAPAAARGARRGIHAARGVRAHEPSAPVPPARRSSSIRAMPPPGACGSSIRASLPHARSPPCSTGSVRSRAWRCRPGRANCSSCCAAWDCRSRPRRVRCAASPGVWPTTRPSARAAPRSRTRSTASSTSSSAAPIRSAWDFCRAHRAGPSRTNSRPMRPSPWCAASSSRSGAPGRSRRWRGWSRCS